MYLPKLLIGFEIYVRMFATKKMISNKVVNRRPWYTTGEPNLVRFIKKRTGRRVEFAGISSPGNTSVSSVKPFITPATINCLALNPSSIP